MDAPIDGRLSWNSTLRNTLKHQRYQNKNILAPLINLRSIQVWQLQFSKIFLLVISNSVFLRQFEILVSVAMLNREKK